MLKIVAMFKFRQDKTYEECRRYWTEVHAAVIRECLPECRRYVQNIPVDIKSKERVVDGVAELWFDDMDAIRRSFEGDLAEQLRADELNFADTSQSNWVIVIEKEAIAFSPGGGRGASGGSTPATWGRIFGQPSSERHLAGPRMSHRHGGQPDGIR